MLSAAIVTTIFLPLNTRDVRSICTTQPVLLLKKQAKIKIRQIMRTNPSLFPPLYFFKCQHPRLGLELMQSVGHEACFSLTCRGRAWWDVWPGRGSRHIGRGWWRDRACTGTGPAQPGSSSTPSLCAAPPPSPRIPPVTQPKILTRRQNVLYKASMFKEPKNV